MNELKNFLLISLGAALLAGGVAFFMLPAKIATGGTPGMAMILHYLSGLSTGQAMALINIPLLLAGFKFIDLRFALRTVYAIALIAALVDLFAMQLNLQITDSLLLSAIYGGGLIGAGVGLVLKGNASAGGTTIIARLIASHSHLKPAQVILVLDVLIVIAVGFIFEDIEKMLWSMLSIYITSRLIDKTLTGAIPEKIVHITSDHHKEIAHEITRKLGTEGSILSGLNLNGDQDKHIIFVLIEARRIPQLKQLVLGVDPQALMIVMEASEITGARHA